ncbi:glycoside hydrolase family 5 protein [Flavobacterium davisii]|uniref:glycoside hydrolase family 5 protein n=1 Tax=Flavobacterium davisii TaxID=2906077 RepID=UPI0021646E65|nr:glycoside hydrolase family 5 protein [Flavobacterium davisii]
MKNEPNLDFEKRKKQNVIPWLENMIDMIKQIDRKHLLTIGYSNKESAEILKDKVDFISFHYYEEPKTFLDSYHLVVKKTKKPVIVGEFGLSSNKNFWNWFGNSKKVRHNIIKECKNILGITISHLFLGLFMIFQLYLTAFLGIDFG